MNAIIRRITRGDWTGLRERGIDRRTARFATRSGEGAATGTPVHRPFTTIDDPPLALARPEPQTVPFVFNSPHSGSHYPPDLLAASDLPLHRLRATEDVAVDRLFADVVALGAPLLAARFPRAWLDVNREPYELDPKLVRERLPGHANTRSLRVAGGLGTVPRLICEGVSIYRDRPSLDDVLWRIERVYRPYHDMLRGLLTQTVMRFGHAVLIDCHSMPSAATKPEGPRPDIILGDRFGTSCHEGLTHTLAQAFERRGYHVVRNRPYAGGFITEHYGKPFQSLHAIQIEINRALYMDERTLRLRDGFDALAQDLTSVMAEIMGQPVPERGAAPLAAE